jgi:protein-tyrosine phosphatase
LGIDAVVSLLETHEDMELDLTREGETCGAHHIEYVSFPIADRGVPGSYFPAMQLLRDLDARLSRGNNVLIHCRQGVGRTGMIAAGLLIYHGIDPQTAIQRVSQARGIQVPETREQLAWLGNLEKSLVH